MARCSSADSIASCASFTRSARSLGEYSLLVMAEGQGGWGSALRDSGRGNGIALPPAEHESPPPAPPHFPVNFRPEGSEVVDCGDQRQAHHEPDGSPRDPVHREEITAEQRPLLP